MGRVASKPGPPWRNSRYGRSRPSGAASSRVKTVIFSPSGFEWSSGTEWARSVRTAPGRGGWWPIADSPFVQRRRQPQGQHNLQSYRLRQPAPSTADHPNQGGWPKTLFKQRSFDPAVDAPPIPGLLERHQQRTTCSSVQTTSGKGPGSLQPQQVGGIAWPAARCGERERRKVRYRVPRINSTGPASPVAWPTPAAEALPHHWGGPARGQNLPFVPRRHVPQKDAVPPGRREHLAVTAERQAEVVPGVSRSARSNFPVSASWTRMTPSPSADATRELSGLNRAASTEAEWPSSLRTSWPVATSQTAARSGR